MREYDVIYWIVISRGKSFVNFNIIKFYQEGGGKSVLKKRKKRKRHSFDHHIPIFCLLHNNIPIRVQKRDSSSKRVSLSVEKNYPFFKIIQPTIQK